MKNLLPCPPDVYAAIVAAECKRFNDMPAAECMSDHEHVGYVPNGFYRGPIVVIVDPDAVTVYCLCEGVWTLCNETMW